VPHRKLLELKPRSRHGIYLRVPEEERDSGLPVERDSDLTEDLDSELPEVRDSELPDAGLTTGRAPDDSVRRISSDGTLLRVSPPVSCLSVCTGAARLLSGDTVRDEGEAEREFWSVGVDLRMSFCCLSSDEDITLPPSIRCGLVTGWVRR
jgi:hypothetical protein